MSDCTRLPLLFTVAMLVAALIASSPAGAQTLKAVKERGTLNCGVGQGLLGFSSQEDKGEWTGLDVDVCRAVAAAVLGDPGKVAFTPLDAASRFEALQSGKIDMLSRNETCERNVSFLGGGIWQHHVPAICDEIVRRSELTAAAWPHGAIVHENTLDVYIARLRRKLVTLPDAPEIVTVHGVGYRLQ